MSSNNLFAAIANFCIFFTLVSILLLKLAESYDESNQNLLVDTEHIGMALLFSHCLLLIICVCMAYYACRHTSEGDFLEAGFETYFKEKEEEKEDGRPKISKMRSQRSSKKLLFSESPSCDEKDIQKKEDEKMNFKEYEGIEINSSFRKKKLFDESDQSKSDEDDEELGVSGLNGEIAIEKFDNNVEIIPPFLSKRKLPLKKNNVSGKPPRTKKEVNKKLPRKKGRKRRKKKAKTKGQIGQPSKFEV